METHQSERKGAGQAHGQVQRVRTQQNDNNLPGDGYGNTSGIKSHDAETDPSHGSPRGEVGWERHAQRTNGAAGYSSRIDSALRRKYGGWGSFG